MYNFPWEQVFGIGSGADFQNMALDVFAYQYENVDIYQQYCNLRGKTTENVHSIEDIPFMPIGFFRDHPPLARGQQEEKVFRSSGTTGSITSSHRVARLDVYDASLTHGFRLFYGKPSDYCILALLPSYLERQDSSLVHMASRLMQLSGHPDNGFFLYNYDELAGKLHQIEQSGRKTLLLGVSFALLDLATNYPMPLKHTLVMETGGMKGRRKEITRQELHGILQNAFSVEHIHSEYGMTELLSQAYSKGEGLYRCPPWMKILTRDVYDPSSSQDFGKTGAINVIDLANIYSCSFIETKDLGKVYTDGSFEVLGRIDHSDTRGCNLMVE